MDQLAVGNYPITAKATDNWGGTVISPAINISVVANKAPSVSLTNPSNGETFSAPATINMQAAALDPDGRIINVDCYNGTTLLNPLTERMPPYTYQWQNEAAGTYTITAKAMDNWGAVTTSAPITITVTSATNPLVSRSSSVNSKRNTNENVRLNLSPNPANDIVCDQPEEL